MLRALISFTILVFIFCSFADEFEALLSRSRMQFCAPKGLKEIQPVANRQMKYEKAYRHKKKKFEVRFAIRPYDKLMAEYERSKKDSFFMYDPNTFYKSSFTATFLNVSDGKDYSYTIYDSTEVKQHFNADWGATTTVESGKEFGMGYKYCMIVYIFRKNVGEGYYFYLADDRKLFDGISDKLQHSLRFAN